jgi:hypothetical protein
MFSSFFEKNHCQKRKHYSYSIGPFNQENKLKKIKISNFYFIYLLKIRKLEEKRNQTPESQAQARISFLIKILD